MCDLQIRRKHFAAERRKILGEIRRAYGHLRNLRGGRHGQAARRRHYRMVAAQKKRLLLAGVERKEILDFLRCCRGGCRQPIAAFQQYFADKSPV